MNYDKDPRDIDEDEMLDDEFDLDTGSDPVYRQSLPAEDDLSAAIPREPEPESEPEPEPEPAQEHTEAGEVKKRKRDRLFKIGEEESGDDFYDAEPEEKRKPAPKVKAPRLDPEDPDYWISDEEESPIGNIFKKPRKPWKWWLSGIAVMLIAMMGAWMWFLRPYTDGAVKYGYLKHMERRGTVMKTFEGILIPYRELGDPTPVYFEEVPFSVAGDSLAARMKAMMLGCVPVRLEYEVYHSALPWKGAERMVVVKADTADTSKILPPEYR